MVCVAYAKAKWPICFRSLTTTLRNEILKTSILGDIVVISPHVTAGKVKPTVWCLSEYNPLINFLWHMSRQCVGDLETWHVNKTRVYTLYASNCVLSWRSSFMIRIQVHNPPIFRIFFTNIVYTVFAVTCKIQCSCMLDAKDLVNHKEVTINGRCTAPLFAKSCFHFA